MSETAIDVDHFRDLLETQRTHIEQARQAIHADHTTTLEDAVGDANLSSFDDGNHMGDLATETHDRELEFGLEENADEVLGEIDAALKRIDAGTYGTCGVCGRPIGKERLEARPWATLCIDDQRRQEQG
jgi:DnaK suppressor protein